MFKLHVINKYNIDIMIEDSPININYISNHIPVIAMKAIYNQDIKKDNVYFANDLYEAKDIYQDIRQKILTRG